MKTAKTEPKNIQYSLQKLTLSLTAQKFVEVLNENDISVKALFKTKTNTQRLALLLC